MAEGASNLPLTTLANPISYIPGFRDATPLGGWPAPGTGWEGERPREPWALGVGTWRETEAGGFKLASNWLQTGFKLASNDASATIAVFPHYARPPHLTHLTL